MGNRRSVALMRCLSQAFGPTASFVAFDALATPVPTACGDRLFFNSKKKEASGVQLPSSSKMPLSNAERLAQRKSLCGSHNMRWPARWVARGGLQEGGWLRDGLARCARWHDLMVFWDGILPGLI